MAKQNLKTSDWSYHYNLINNMYEKRIFRFNSETVSFEEICIIQISFDDDAIVEQYEVYFSNSEIHKLYFDSNHSIKSKNLKQLQNNIDNFISRVKKLLCLI